MVVGISPYERLLPLFSCRCGIFDTERSFTLMALFHGRGLYDWMARSNFELLRVFAEDQSSLSNLLVI